MGWRNGEANFYAYVRNNPVVLADPTGLCADPGGTGVRYCIDRFIPDPQKYGFFGDNRGLAANGDNTSRMRISVSSAGVKCDLGQTNPLVGPALPGIPGGSVGTVIQHPLGGRKRVGMRFLKTAFEVALLVAVLISTITGYYWVLTRYFGMPKDGAILILAPTALLACLTAIYAYYLGWRRYQERQEGVMSVEHGLERGVASTRDQVRTAFERRFRILVFGLVLILPMSLALFAFLGLRDMAEGTLFGIIAAVVAPWVIRKIMAEMQTGEER